MFLPTAPPPLPTLAHASFVPGEVLCSSRKGDYLMYSINLEGKKGLILGVSNARSIAWAIAGPVAQAGARLAFSYQGERLESTLEKLTKDLSEPVLFPCDVTNDEELDALF